MSKTEMVHIVDMTIEEFQEAAAQHRARGQHDTAASMMLLPPVLANLTEEQRARLRRLPVKKLQIELSKLVRFKSGVVDVMVYEIARAGLPLDAEMITDAVMGEYEEMPRLRGPKILRGVTARESIVGLVRDAIAETGTVGHG